MADTLSPEDMRKEFDKQIADLKKEVGALSKMLARQGAESLERTRESAADALDRAKGHARGSLQHVREQAQLVSDTMKENPGTAATVLSSAGVIGFVLGLIVGTQLSSHSRHW